MVNKNSSGFATWCGIYQHFAFLETGTSFVKFFL